MRDDFCVMILTHGRPQKVITHKSLRKQGYTGKIFLVVDDEDSTIGQYQESFGKDSVLVFSKSEIGKRFDAGDNIPGNRGVIYARNAVYDLAEKQGYPYFAVFDDDYTEWYYKFTSDLTYTNSLIKNLDFVFNELLEFYLSVDSPTIAMAQMGDFMGGADSSMAKRVRLSRKVMNTWFCSIHDRVWFYGRINEDVNLYACSGRSGVLFLTVPLVAVNQVQTQASSGGMTGLYLDHGTYYKSFYSVMYAPSCVSINDMGTSNRRLHHRVSWNNACPKIVHENLMKR